MSIDEVLAALKEVGEYVKSPQSFVEVPVIAQIEARFRVASNVAQGHKSISQWDTGQKDAGKSRIDPPVRAQRSDVAHEVAPEQARWAESHDIADAWAYESWKLYGFTDPERDAWIASGLRPGQVKVAQDLRDADLEPGDLQRDLYGWTVLQRITSGEGAKGIVRMLREAS